MTFRIISPCYLFNKNSIANIFLSLTVSTVYRVHIFSRRSLACKSVRKNGIAWLTNAKTMSVQLERLINEYLCEGVANIENRHFNRKCSVLLLPFAQRHSKQSRIQMMLDQLQFNKISSFYESKRWIRSTN